MTSIRRSLMRDPDDLERRSDANGDNMEIPRTTRGEQVVLPALTREAWRHVPSHPAPGLESLTSALSAILCHDGVAMVLDRKPNIYASTYHSEIVTCRLPDGSERQVLCKRSVGDGNYCHGHRGGIPYEAEVYRNVLSGIQLTIPTFYGDHADTARNQAWLILEFLENAALVKHMHEIGAMSLAAQWIGRFHAMNEARITCARMRFLNRYDSRYYLGWSHRAWLFAEPVRHGYPWLAQAHTTYAKAVDWLLGQPLTVIHGEYYSINVLFAGGSVYPVDWESAAVAPGEIDLACVTERWPEERVREMELEYQRARWPDGAPAEFARTLAAARLYLIFRWLGDRPEWTTGEECHWRFEQLRLAIERWKSLGTD